MGGERGGILHWSVYRCRRNETISAANMQEDLDIGGKSGVWLGIHGEKVQGFCVKVLQLFLVDPFAEDGVFIDGRENEKVAPLSNKKCK